MKKMEFDKMSEVKINECIAFPDGLNICLEGFSHKRSLKGGAKKATAYLKVKDSELNEDLSLSVHSSDRGPDKYDRLSKNRYDFSLTDFTYDARIKLIVNKHKTQNEKYNQTFNLELNTRAIIEPNFMISITSFGEKLNSKSEKISYIQFEIIAGGTKSDKDLDLILFSNGTPRIGEGWIGEMGLSYSGRIIKLHHIELNKFAKIEVIRMK